MEERNDLEDLIYGMEDSWENGLLADDVDCGKVGWKIGQKNLCLLSAKILFGSFFVDGSNGKDETLMNYG